MGTVPSNIWGQFSSIIPLLGGVDVATFVARIFTVVYFAFFIMMPIYSKKDVTKKVPRRVTISMKMFAIIFLLYSSISFSAENIELSKAPIDLTR